MSEEVASEREKRRARRRARLREAHGRGLDTSVPSPCITVCQLDDLTGLCIGCLRNSDEIREWPILSAEEKKRVLAEIEIRKVGAKG